jgi:hypothetical protein
VIDESASGPFQVFDGGVARFYFRCGGAGEDEDFDCLPPAADCAPGPRGLGLGGERAGEELLADALVVAAVNDAEDLPGVQIDDGGHSMLEARPGLGFGVLE